MRSFDYDSDFLDDFEFESPSERRRKHRGEEQHKRKGHHKAAGHKTRNERHDYVWENDDWDNDDSFDNYDALEFDDYSGLSSPY